MRDLIEVLIKAAGSPLVEALPIGNLPKAALKSLSALLQNRPVNPATGVEMDDAQFELYVVARLDAAADPWKRIEARAAGEVASAGDPTPAPAADEDRPLQPGESRTISGG
jgi:hypothetical protein